MMSGSGNMKLLTYRKVNTVLILNDIICFSKLFFVLFCFCFRFHRIGLIF